ncbi:unnamed protein product, partial [Scytosiphon promiscuus]
LSPGPRGSTQHTPVPHMSGPRGRSRRRGTGSGGTVSTASRVLMVLITVFAVTFLLKSHKAVTNEARKTVGRPADTPSEKRAGVPPRGGTFSGATSAEDDAFPMRGGGSGAQGFSKEVRLPQGKKAAEGPMDYVELQCEGGEPDVDLSYWKDITQDKTYESPWGASAREARAQGMPQYVTFEPDNGGFNNIRMAMETVLVFARETGRTLVMPAAQKFYLLNKPAAEFADMFPIEYLSDYMDVISMEDFLQTEGVTGRLGKRPPGNKISGHGKDELQEYLREVADIVPHWNHMEKALVFGPSPENPAVPDDHESQ